MPPPSSKKPKAKKPAPAPLTPKRVTVVVTYSFRGLNVQSMGFGGKYRYLRQLLRQDFHSGMSLAPMWPLEVRLVETGEELGRLDWGADDEAVKRVAEAISISLRRYLNAPYVYSSATNKLEPPGQFRGSGSFANLLPVVKVPKKKKKKKKAAKLKF